MKQFTFHLTTEHREFHGVVRAWDEKQARLRIEAEFGKDRCQQIQLKEVGGALIEYCEVEVLIRP